MKILTILGARPQFIKAAPLSKTINDFNKTNTPGIQERILHTGQHYNHELSGQIIEELGLPLPYVNLNTGSGSHGSMTGEMIMGIEKQIMAETPDFVLVYGDTNSTLAGALAAVKLGIPVCHVEAGLRSHNKKMPEEINRILTDHVSTLLFVPTQGAVLNLKVENIYHGVYHTGDIMYDAALLFGDLASKQSDILERMQLAGFCVATVHRQENTDNRENLAEIIKAFDDIAGRECPVIFPIHPRTEKMMKQFGIAPRNPDVRIIPPVSFLDMISLEKNAKAILTDSGGMQKEAYFHGTPCITLRDETEWTETVDAGWNQITGARADAIVAAMGNTGKGKIINDYGEGKATVKMIEILLDHFPSK